MFKWYEEYASGIEAVDEQHYNLFEIARDVVDLLNEEDLDTDVLYETFERLVQYSIYHFATEEEFWILHDVKLYEQQREAHKYFVNWLNSLDLSLMETNGKKFVLNIFEELSLWIKNHVEIEMQEIIRLSRS
ncbi:MAG: hemerythrin family protein [Clostridia bacterium]|nr:hemerythrin family protein [Clostridia bacterium]